MVFSFLSGDRLRRSYPYILALITFLTIYYPLSFELALLNSADQSQPKIFDILYMGTFPLFCLVLMQFEKTYKALLKFCILAALIVYIFTIQYLLVIDYGTFLPKVHFLARYLQYFSWILVLYMAMRHYGPTRLILHFAVVSIVETVIFIGNAFFIEDALNKNIVGTFRGSFDAGAFFVLVLCLVGRFRKDIENTYGKIFFWIVTILTYGNLFFASSRTASLIGIIMLLRYVTINLPLIAMVGAGLVFGQDYLSTKVTKLFTLLLNNGFDLRVLLSDSSIEMRWENFIKLWEFVDYISDNLGLIVLGTGPGYFQRYVRLYGEAGTFDCYPLRVFSEYGLVGLFVFIAFLLLTARASLWFACALFVLTLTSDTLVASKVVPLIILGGLLGYNVYRQERMQAKEIAQ